MCGGHRPIVGCLSALYRPLWWATAGTLLGLKGFVAAVALVAGMCDYSQ